MYWGGWSPEQPEVISENEVAIGADGTAKVTIDTGPAKAAHGDEDHEYQISAEVTDASRRTIVERLARGPASVSQLAKPLAMSLPAVVQHLQVLEISGLVRSQKMGRVRTCRIEPKALRAAEQWIAQRRSFWERNLDRLGDFLATEIPDKAESDAGEKS